ncbi:MULTISPECIES: hypothetical protein [unclassified Bradyrhizobium]|uniref:hypothetical protein n=1 Tax=unclassified Bradyrhizobium TaxID=2631580 RepID=UPI0028E50E23|nr:MULTISPECIES: hypothetical protein [unclassified Bradyrhizobium]
MTNTSDAQVARHRALIDMDDIRDLPCCCRAKSMTHVRDASLFPEVVRALLVISTRQALLINDSAVNYRRAAFAKRPVACHEYGSDKSA